MSAKDRLSHVAADGAAHMVDVGDKAVTRREARAGARVHMRSATRHLIERGETPKGAVLGTARIAGIQAAKRTAELIPLCHPLSIESVEISFDWSPSSADEAELAIEAKVRVESKTGVEMEALTAAAVAALTVYDMCKAVDRGMRIDSIELLEKSGGRSGPWRREARSSNRPD